MDSERPGESGAVVRGPGIAQASITRAETQLGMSLPLAWTDNLRRDDHLVRGDMATGEFVMVWNCDEAMDVIDAWAEASELHPGFYPLGSDGSREMYCLDLRDSGRGVQLVQVVSSGWADAIPLQLSIQEFIEAIDSQQGFTIPWPDDPA